MATYWMVTISWWMPFHNPNDPGERPMNTDYGLFLSLESAIAAVNKGAGVHVPFIEGKYGEYRYDPDEASYLSFLPGIFMITITPYTLEDPTNKLAAGLKMLIEMGCKEDERRRKR